MASRKWTKEEDDIVRRTYEENLNVEEQANKINRAVTAFRKRASTIGVASRYEDLTGKTFGKLKVLKRVGTDKHDCSLWLCECSCPEHNRITVNTHSLKSGNTRSCGCLSRTWTQEELNLLEEYYKAGLSYKEIALKLGKTEHSISGKIGALHLADKYEHFRKRENRELHGKFGMLTVLGFDKIKNGKTYFKCRCDCGNIVSAEQWALVSGKTYSCGCVIRRNEVPYPRVNRYDLDSEEYGIGYTSKDEKFYFDKEDFELIKPYNWHLNSNGYVVSRDNHEETVFMHRLILHVSDPDIEVDHIDTNLKRDNRKCNLRLSDKYTNRWNKKLSHNSKSGIQGVYPTTDGRWTAQLREYDTVHCLGTYSRKEDAAKARRRAEDKYFGDFSYNNSQKIMEDTRIRE